MSTNHTIPCPKCQSDITFNAQALIAGASFECQTCRSQIKMSSSSMNQAKEVFDKFTDLKNKIASK